jgi:hypothetical protein
MSEAKTSNLRAMVATYAALARKAARFWRRAALVFALVLAAGIVWILKRPRVYKSEASAAIYDVGSGGNEPRSPDEAQAELHARLDQVYGSRANLGRVVDELNLYPWLRGHTSRMKIIESFQGGFEYAAAGRDAFHLQFVYQDAHVAQRAVERLLRLYTDERRAAGQLQARSDLASVDTSIAALETVLTAQEDRLEHFENANHDMVEQVRLRRLGQTQLRLGQGIAPAATLASAAPPVVSEPTDSTRTRRLRVRLAALQGRLSALARADETPRAAAPSAPATPTEEPERLQTARRNVSELRERLARLRTTYTDEYPDVRITVRRLDDAERELASQLAAEHSRTRAAAAVVVPPVNAEQRRAQITSIEREIEASRAALTDSLHQDREHPTNATAGTAPEARASAGTRGAAASRTSSAASASAASPSGAASASRTSAVAATAPGAEMDRPLGSLVEVESAWDRLLSELGTTRQRYQTLLARKFELQAQLDTVNSTGADVLRVIDPPTLAAEPEPPGRTKLAAIVLALAIVLGLGVAALSAFLDPKIYEAADLRRWGELPELPAIPELRFATASAVRGAPARGGDGSAS